MQIISALKPTLQSPVTNLTTHSSGNSTKIVTLQAEIWKSRSYESTHSQVNESVKIPTLQAQKNRNQTNHCQNLLKVLALQIKFGKQIVITKSPEPWNQKIPTLQAVQNRNLKYWKRTPTLQAQKILKLWNRPNHSSGRYTWDIPLQVKL